MSSELVEVLAKNGSESNLIGMETAVFISTTFSIFLTIKWRSGPEATVFISAILSIFWTKKWRINFRKIQNQGIQEVVV